MLLSLVLFAAFAGSAPLPQAAIRPCIVMENEVPLAGRGSRLDSVAVQLNGREVKVCYGRPSLRGRKMLGGDAVPFGQLWRTGANEPTMIHTDIPLTVAGIAISPGTYSLYTVPGAAEWEIIVNRSITQWGHESTYTPEVQAKEVGRGRVKPETLSAPVETFTVTLAPPAGNASSIVLEWQTTRVRIPIEAGR